MKQLTIFDQPTGPELRDAGMKQALDHADSIDWPLASMNKIVGDSIQKLLWSEVAYSFLLSWIRPGIEFMAEDVRIASEGIVPEPPHLRSWGAIFVRARRSGVIRCIGTQKVKTPSNHCANAAVWMKI